MTSSAAPAPILCKIEEAAPKSRLPEVMGAVEGLNNDELVVLASHCIATAADRAMNKMYAPVLAATALDALPEDEREAFITRYLARSRNRGIRALVGA